MTYESIQLVNVYRFTRRRKKWDADGEEEEEEGEEGKEREEKGLHEEEEEEEVAVLHILRLFGRFPQ